MVLQFVHDVLFGGIVEKGGSWGGPECRAAGERWASGGQKAAEASFWLLLAAAVYYAIDVPKVFKWMHDVSTKELESQARSKAAAKGFWQLTYERVLAAVHFVLFGMLIYWKYIDRVSVLLTQPCHLIVLLQGIALLSTTSLGPLITVLQMPTLFGSLLAMLVPATDGLRPLEVTHWWVEHAVIQAGPLYLLSRQNGIALKLCNLKTFVFGIWICEVAHFAFYNAVDHLFNVNVEFMLCPTAGMVEIFRGLPPNFSALSWPSTIAFGVITGAFFLFYVYVFSARLISLVVHSPTTSAKGRFEAKSK